LLRPRLLQQQPRIDLVLRQLGIWRLLHKCGMLRADARAVLLRSDPLLLMQPTAIHDQFASELRRFAASRVAPSDVDDLLQDVFERVVRASADPAAQLRDDESIRPWLYRVVRNAITDHQRRRRPAALDADVEPAVEPRDAAEDEAAAARCLVPLMAELAPPARAALESIELNGTSVKAAAAGAGISESAMKSRVLRARADLRAALTRCCAVELDRRGGVAALSPRCATDCGCVD
jgi:RNA polymerase sigma-70 factor (ECF subfamily)